jgi:hypothetical protein
MSVLSAKMTANTQPDSGTTAATDDSAESHVSASPYASCICGDRRFQHYDGWQHCLVLGCGCTFWVPEKEGE